MGPRAGTLAPPAAVRMCPTTDSAVIDRCYSTTLIPLDKRAGGSFYYAHEF